jgi:hypothetical protein
VATTWFGIHINPGRRNPNRGLDEAASLKKTYGKLKLNRLDPQEALAKIKRAAEAGNKSAKTMPDRISALRRRP